MRRLKTYQVFIGLLVIVFLTGCGSSTSTEEKIENHEVIKIGVLIYRFDDQFISYVMQEIQNEKLRFDSFSSRTLKVDFVDGNNQADLQLDQVKEMLAEEYDVLAINLVDRSQAATVIDLAKAVDVPIVFFNREPVQVDMARWDRIYYVGSKGEDAGAIQGDIVAETWFNQPDLDKNGDGIIQYIMIKGQAGHQDTIIRTEHSIKSIRTHGIEVEELVSDTANWQRQEAKEKMYNYLEMYKDEVEFIISNNDMMALGTIDAMKELGYTSETMIPIVGVDAIDDALTALDNGDMTGTVFNDSSKQGEMVMRIAYYLAINEEPKDFIEEIESSKYYRVEYQKVTRTDDLD